MTWQTPHLVALTAASGAAKGETGTMSDTTHSASVRGTAS